MSDLGHRRRVERMLAGDLRVEDLIRLFLYLRDKSDGRASVREIGDFVAHQETRTKGLVTKLCSDMFDILFFRTVYEGVKTWDATRIHASALPFLKATAARLSPSDYREDGYTKKQSEILLKEIINGIQTNEDGTLAVVNRHGYLTISLRSKIFMDLLMSTLVIREAFTGITLFADFSSCLKSNGLLQKSEIHRFALLSSFVQLFAMSAMHGATILINGTQFARLQLGFAAEKPNFHPYVENSIPASPKLAMNVINLVTPVRRWVTPIMTSEIECNNSCDTGLDPVRGTDLDREIEVNSLIKLVYV